MLNASELPNVSRARKNNALGYEQKYNNKHIKQYFWPVITKHLDEPLIFFYE
jgi:hypothetical protein